MSPCPLPGRQVRRRRSCGFGRMRSPAYDGCFRGKVTRSWRSRSLEGERAARADRRYAGGLVLCHSLSGSGASLDACDGSGCMSVFVPPSDRCLTGSVFGVFRSTTRAPLNRTARVQRRCVYRSGGYPFSSKNGSADRVLSRKRLRSGRSSRVSAFARRCFRQPATENR